MPSTASRVGGEDVHYHHIWRLPLAHQPSATRTALGQPMAMSARCKGRMATAPTLQDSAPRLRSAMKPSMIALLRSLLPHILELSPVGGIQRESPLPARAFGGNALDLRSRALIASNIQPRYVQPRISQSR